MDISKKPIKPTLSHELNQALTDVFRHVLRQTLKQTTNMLTAGFITAGIAIYVTSPAIANQKMTLAPGFAPDPQVLTGLSGGISETTDCGFIKPVDAPDYVLTLTAPFNFLRASVQAEGDVTLLVEGPNGRICSDDVNGLMPEISGAAPAGTYTIWIGDYVGNPNEGFNYQLTLTTEQDGSIHQTPARISARSTHAGESSETHLPIISRPSGLPADRATPNGKQFKPQPPAW